jgi:pyoverdine/dityrosine biosynthesis protein Dit1
MAYEARSYKSTKTKKNLVISKDWAHFMRFFFSICPSCIKGKHYGIIFLKEHQKFKKFWNLHSDVCGLLRILFFLKM